AGAHNDDHPQGDLDKDKGEVAEDQAPSSEEESAEDHSEGGDLDKDKEEVAEDQAPSAADKTAEDDSDGGGADEDEGEVAEDQAQSSEDKTEEDHSEGGGLDEDEDEAAEDDAEEEPDTPPNFTPNGPSLDVRDVAPETDSTIRVGDNERTYTTDSHGSAGINIVDDFELPPGSHQVTITGPDGHKQEVTFYATGMQVANTRVNVLGLDPSATYQLSENGRIAQ